MPNAQAQIEPILLASSRRVFRFCVLTVSVYFLSVNNLFSAPPVPFDSWSNTGGRINAACPAGFTCNDNVRDAGILQRELVDRNGRRYYHLIIDDGVMANLGRTITESFVDGSNTNTSGVAVKQRVVEQGTENMDFTAIVNTGWADAPGSPTIEMTQNIVDTTPEGVAFNQSFEYRNNQDATGAISGYWFGIRQRVDNSTVLQGIAAGQDVHVFVLRRAGGNMNTASGSATLPAAAGGMAGMAGGGGGMAGGGGGGMMSVGTLSARANTSLVSTRMMNGGGGTAPAPAPAPAPVAPPAAGGGTTAPPATGGGTTPPPGGGGTTTPPVAGTPAPAPAPVPIQRTGGTGLIGQGTSTGAGDIPPCGTQAPPNAGSGQPPPCSTQIAPPNPGSQGSGTGAGAAAPPGTLNPPPRGSGTQPVPGGLIVGNPAGMGMGGGGPAGGSISWNAGDEVQVIWIGQICTGGCMTAGGAMGGMGGANGSFSFQAYENLSTTAPAIVTRSILGTAPFTWNPTPFGAQPGL